MGRFRSLSEVRPGLVVNRHVPLFENLAAERPLAALAAAKAERVAVQLGLVAERGKRRCAVRQKFQKFQIIPAKQDPASYFCASFRKRYESGSTLKVITITSDGVRIGQNTVPLR